MTVYLIYSYLHYTDEHFLPGDFFSKRNQLRNCVSICTGMTMVSQLQSIF